MAETFERSDYPEIREAVRRLCAQFPGEYWRELDRETAYPTEFVEALTEAGYLALLIPEEYGGSGLPLSRGRRDPRGDPPRRLQRRRLPRPDVHHGHAAAARQRRRRSSSYLPRIAAGELRLQAFGVTEPTTGTDTTQAQDHAPCSKGDRYVVNGQKVWTSRARALRPDAAARAHHAAPSR